MKDTAIRQQPKAVGFLTCLLAAILWTPAAGISQDKPTPPPEPKTFSDKLMDFATQDYLTGDWAGLRSGLSKHGVDFEFFYVGDVPINFHGGIDEGSAYQGFLWMIMDLDSEKLAGYHGGHLRFSSVSIHGEDHFSDRHIGDFNKVSLIDFPSGFRLMDLWYEQRLLQDKLSVKLGQMTVDQDFIVPEFYNSVAFISFLNQTFFYPTLAFNLWDIPTFPVGHNALPSIPYGTPGARIKYSPLETVYVQAAVYDGSPDTSASYFRLNPNLDDSLLAYFELGYKLNQAKNDSGLPGNYKIGSYLHTGDFSDNEDVLESFVGLSTGTQTHSPNYGFYFLADQTLYFEQGKEDPARQGMAGFFRLTGAPPDRNLTQFGIDGGVVYRGLIPGRDYDSIGLAGSYLEMSDDLADGQRTINPVLSGLGAPEVPIVDYEAVVELSYRAQLTAWWTLQGSLQRVIHPGGKALGNIDDAWAAVFLTTVRF